MLLVEALQMNPVALWRDGWTNDFKINAHKTVSVSVDDLLADDWCAEEKSVNINLSDLKLLVNKHIAEGFEMNSKFEKMIKEIGL